MWSASSKPGSAFWASRCWRFRPASFAHSWTPFSSDAQLHPPVCTEPRDSLEPDMAPLGYTIYEGQHHGSPAKWLRVSSKAALYFKNVDRIEIPLHKQNMQVWSSHAVLHGEMQFHYQRMAVLQPPVHRLDGGCTLIVAWPNVELGRIEAGIHRTTPWHWWKQQIYIDRLHVILWLLKKIRGVPKRPFWSCFFLRNYYVIFAQLERFRT